MLSATVCDSYAREMFELFWREACQDPQRRNLLADIPDDSAPHWMLNDILRLLQEHHARPASDLAPLVRRMFLEHDLIDVDIGDSIVSQSSLASLDSQVDLVVEALERVRRHCLESGRWCGVAAGPEMFG